MKTQLHRYSFDISKPEQAAAYEELCAKLRDGRHFFNVLDTPGNGKGCPAGEVTVEPEHLFEDQWNVQGPDGNGYRVFDWFEAIYPNRSIKAGHYLELTPELRELRRNTHKCGYCGKQEPAAKGYTFCPHCVGSEHLEEKQLHLTRLIPVADDAMRKRNVRPELTDAEREHLVPLYREAQSKRVRRAAVDLRPKLIRERDKAIEKAKTECDGKIWLLDHDYPLANVIYYDHKGQFCFGWRTPLAESEVQRVLGFISEFPFPYLIKGFEGDNERTWEGY